MPANLDLNYLDWPQMNRTGEWVFVLSRADFTNRIISLYRDLGPRSLADNTNHICPFLSLPHLSQSHRRGHRLPPNQSVPHGRYSRFKDSVSEPRHRLLSCMQEKSLGSQRGGSSLYHSLSHGQPASWNTS